MKGRFLTSFAALNLAQFLSALNDNIFKLLLIFMLIHLKGPASSNMILSLAGAIFVIPFLLFASIAGTLADRFSKRNVIVVIRSVEIAVMILAVWAISRQSAVGGYLILFAMATLSALFSPCKFGIIPEIVPSEKISHYNGILTATTYLAIILGTFLAALLADITHRDFVFSSSICIVIAVLGAFFSFWIKKTPPAASFKKVSPRVFTEIYRTLRKAKKIRYLLVAIIFAGYFLFMGSYVQLNIIPFALQSLHLSEVQGGYLFLMTAIGIGLGSFLSGRLSGKEVELGFVPLATMGIMATLFGLSLFASQFYLVSFLLVLLGILGGFYIVPMESFIQAASPPENRGQNVAAANFISFLGVIIASFLIGFLGGILKLSASTGFFIVGLITFFVALLLFLLMADSVLRLVIAKCARYFWGLKVVGRRNLKNIPLLLVAERHSWLDTVVVMAALPRLIRYIVPIEGRFVKTRSLIYRLLAIIPLDSDHFVLLGSAATDLIEKELSLGHPVCLMQPTKLRSRNLAAWEEEVGRLISHTKVPILPVHITRKRPHKQAGYIAQLLSLFKGKVTVTFGEIQS